MALIKKIFVVKTSVNNTNLSDYRTNPSFLQKTVTTKTSEMDLLYDKAVSAF